MQKQMSFGSLLSTVLLYYDFSQPERKETRLIMMFKVPLCIPYFLAALQFDGFPFFGGFFLDRRWRAAVFLMFCFVAEEEEEEEDCFMSCCFTMLHF